MNFRHRGLKRLFEADDERGVKQDQLKRIRRVLAVLDEAGPFWTGREKSKMWIGCPGCVFTD